MELFEAIRRDHRRDQLSIRALADRHEVHRRTVRQALDNAVPPERKTPERSAPKLDPAKALIDAMLIPIWMRRESSGTPPGGSWHGWSMSTPWRS